MTCTGRFVAVLLLAAHVRARPGQRPLPGSPVTTAGAPGYGGACGFSTAGSCGADGPEGGSAVHVPGGPAGVAAGVHRPAGRVLQRRGIAGVVPGVPAHIPVAVGLRSGAVPGADLDVAVGAEGIGGELEAVPGGVAQRPVGEADIRARGVVQPDPFVVQAGVGAGVWTG